MSNCLSCNCPTTNPKFCSRSCAAKHNNRVHPKRIKTNSCKICSEPILSSLTYCSPNCMSLGRATTRSEEEIKKAKSTAVTSWRRRVKVKAVELLGGSCYRCGYSKCISALHFHHKDSAKKEFQISGISISWDRIKKELSKCELVCSNCHSEIHEEIRKAPATGFEPV